MRDTPSGVGPAVGVTVGNRVAVAVGAEVAEAAGVIVRAGVRVRAAGAVGVGGKVVTGTASVATVTACVAQEGPLLDAAQPASSPMPNSQIRKCQIRIPTREMHILFSFNPNDPTRRCTAAHMALCSIAEAHASVKISAQILSVDNTTIIDASPICESK